MEFGKISDISAVEWSFGKIPEFNASIKSTQPLAQIYYGCTSWTDAQCKGRYYPSNLKKADFLNFYSKQFSSIEFNTTFYRIPDSDLVSKWYHETEKEFKFCPKLHQSISRSSTLGIDAPALNEFCERILGFQEKLGLCFLQLPPDFSPEQIHILERFLKYFPINEIPLNIEFRHADWFKAENLNVLLELMHKYNAGMVITDVSGRRDVLHLGLSNSSLMIRFVGNDLHDSDFIRLDEWCGLLIQWMGCQLDELYLFAHQPDNLMAPKLCAYFMDKIEQSSTFRFDRKIQDFSDQQLSLF